jgi:ribonuclease D
MKIITESPDLAAFCARIAGTEFITIDTEFLRDQTYWPKLCLIQVAGPEDAAAIDVLAPEIDLAPLEDLLRDTGTLKVVHAGRQDMEIFFHRNGWLPEPLFDTQIAAMVCGFGDSVAYDTLARRLVGARIDKTSRFTDWSRRPLSDQQLRYAIADVTYLRDVYLKLRKTLERTGRESWLAEELAVLTSPDTYCLDPQASWRRLKPRSIDRLYLSILRELAALRENEAQRRDLPRNRILRDEQLYDIAALRPATVQDLGRARRSGGDLARGRLGEAIVAAVQRGLDCPADERPKLAKKEELPKELGPVVELLKVLLRIRCAESEVAQLLIARSNDIEKIALDDNAKVAALEGWRREVYGEDALRLKRGELALVIRNNNICLMPVAEPMVSA